MFYEEDHYHPNNVEYDFEKNQKKSKVAVNMYLDNADKYECKVPCIVGGRKKNVKLYRSVNKIRNAVTGILYEDSVGSFNENLYFKVSVPTVSGLFFFDSPEDFERHMFSEVNDRTKTRWREINTQCKNKVINS